MPLNTQPHQQHISKTDTYICTPLKVYALNTAYQSFKDNEKKQQNNMLGIVNCRRNAAGRSTCQVSSSAIRTTASTSETRGAWDNEKSDDDEEEDPQR